MIGYLAHLRRLWIRVVRVSKDGTKHNNAAGFGIWIRIGISAKKPDAGSPSHIPVVVDVSVSSGGSEDVVSASSVDSDADPVADSDVDSSADSEEAVVASKAVVSTAVVVSGAVERAVSPEEAVSDGKEVKEESSGRVVCGSDVLAAVEVAVAALGAEDSDVGALGEEGEVLEVSSSESDVPVAVGSESSVDSGSSVDLGSSVVDFRVGAAVVSASDSVGSWVSEAEGSSEAVSWAEVGLSVDVSGAGSLGSELAGSAEEGSLVWVLEGAEVGSLVAEGCEVGSWVGSSVDS